MHSSLMTAVRGQPRVWLRSEGLMTACMATAVYGSTGYSWLIFAILFFAPDLSLLGYVAGPRVGAVIYNLFHSYAAPLALALVLMLLDRALPIPLIWAAHIGFDRLLGYGLKYPSAFQDTHLGRIGRRIETA